MSALLRIIRKLVSMFWVGNSTPVRIRKPVSKPVSGGIPSKNPNMIVCASTGKSVKASGSIGSGFGMFDFGYAWSETAGTVLTAGDGKRFIAIHIASRTAAWRTFELSPPTNWEEFDALCERIASNAISGREFGDGPSGPHPIPKAA